MREWCITDICKCGYKACKKQNLDKHMHETHKNGRDRLKCDECDHKESSKDCLKYHMAAKHYKELFRCEKCDYQSATKRSLKSHMTAKYNGECIWCEKCDNQIQQKCLKLPREGEKLAIEKSSMNRLGGIWFRFGFIY